jgi:hypothetical protein
VGGGGEFDQRGASAAERRGEGGKKVIFYHWAEWALMGRPVFFSFSILTDVVMIEKNKFDKKG